MGIVKGAVGLTVSLVIVCAVTAILWYAKLAGIGPNHPMFLYLLPIVLVATLYGSLAAILCTLAAMICAAFFLYDPIYSFYIADRLEWGDLICFAMLALIGVKSMVELLRPTAKIAATPSRYGRP